MGSWFVRATVLTMAGLTTPAASPVAQAQRGADACTALAKLQMPGIALSGVKTEWFAAGAPPPAEPPYVPPLAVKLPAYCRVDATIDQRTGGDGKPYGIGFAIALPADWNGRFLFQGGGGLNGSVAPRSARPVGGDAALARGFAVVNHRHRPQGQVFDASFMQEQQASLDFAYQAVGRVAILAKQIIAQHYGKAPDHAYFDGCSTGGREGMLMAQRYPTYFDGVIVGAPAMRTSFSGIGDEWVATMLNQAAPKDAAGKPDLRRALSEADRKAVHRWSAHRLRSRDGVKDGMVFDPVGCRFDPKTLVVRATRSTAVCRRRRRRRSRRPLPAPRTRRAVRSIRASCSTPASPPHRAFPASARRHEPGRTALHGDGDERGPASRGRGGRSADALTATSTWTNLNTFSSAAES